MASVGKAKVGDLVLSQTKCYGIVLYYMPEADHYIILWTIFEGGGLRFNEQLRDPKSFTRA